MDNDILFFYGTLRRQAGSEMHRLLASCADYYGRAVYKGRLYRVDYYPGVIPSECMDDLVVGELYLLKDTDALFPELDRYEGIGSGFEEPTLYVRRRGEFVLENGETRRGWIYIYNRSVEELERISSGDFLDVS